LIDLPPDRWMRETSNSHCELAGFLIEQKHSRGLFTQLGNLIARRASRIVVCFETGPAETM